MTDRESGTPRAPRILIVDDEQGLRRLMAKVLGDEGFEVLEAGSVQEALNQPGPFDAMVVDWNLPDGVGSTVVAAHPEAASLYISGTPGHGLEKPFGIFTLRESIRKLLNKGSP